VARSSAQVSCVDPPPGRAGVVCLAFDGTSTSLSLVDADRGRVVPVTSLPGRLWPVLHADATRIVVGQGTGIVLVDVKTRRLRKVELPGAGGCGEGAWVPGALAMLCRNDDGAVARVFRVEEQ
jgi:hypothetical protein